MIRQFLLFCTTFLLGVVVLVVSIYSSMTPVNPSLKTIGRIEEINLSEHKYSLPDVGMIAPNSPLWPIAAIGDNLQLHLMDSEMSRSFAYLSYADRRLVQSNYLLEAGEYNHAALVLRKAEMYLEKAYDSYVKASAVGAETQVLYGKIVAASLAHLSIIDESLEYYPENTRPGVIETMNYSRRILNVLSNKNGLDLTLR